MLKWAKVKQLLDVLSAVMVVAIAGLLIWREVDQRWFAPRPRPAVEDVKDLTIPAARVRHVRGSGSVVLVELTDYQCPYCGRHARDAAPVIDAELVDRGAIRHVVLHHPLTAIHPLAAKASEAAECAGRQGRFWDMHARLFENQRALAEDDLLRSADALELDRAAFQQCLAGEAAAEIRSDLSEGTRLGVRATPTFFYGIVNGDGSVRLVKRINGAVPFQQFSELLKAVQPDSIAQR